MNKEIRKKTVMLVLAVAIIMALGMILLEERHAFLPKEVDLTTEQFAILPAYMSKDGKKATGPLTFFVKNGKSGTIRHFPDWKEEFRSECFMTQPAEVNGRKILAYTNWEWRLKSCFGRVFMVTNASHKVYELYPNGKRRVLNEQLPEPGIPSDLICDPRGWLLVSIQPGLDKKDPSREPLVGPQIVRISLEGEVLKTVVLPDETKNMRQVCTAFTNTWMAVPTLTDDPLLIDKEGLVWKRVSRQAFAIKDDGTIYQDNDFRSFTGIKLIVTDPILQQLVTVPVSE